jgi:hypothetical protein
MQKDGKEQRCHQSGDHTGYGKTNHPYKNAKYNRNEHK